MGVRILDSDSGRVALYCSTSETTIACPLFHDEAEAEAFLAWLRPLDVRAIDAEQRKGLVASFRAERCRDTEACATCDPVEDGDAALLCAEGC